MLEDQKVAEFVTFENGLVLTATGMAASGKTLALMAAIKEIENVLGIKAGPVNDKLYGGVK